VRQNLKLRCPAALKSASSLPASAGRDQYRARPLASKPLQESRTLLGVPQVIEPQLKRPGRPQGKTKLKLHSARGFRSNDSADTLFPEYAFQTKPPPRT
jgi:hypothetical protein